jgi:membrane-bound serine protease (ClpP class)
MVIWRFTATAVVVLLSVMLVGASEITPAATTEPHGGPVLVAPMNSPITPVTAEFVRKAIAKADEDRCELIVFEMDTPGGLVSSTEEIIQVILASHTPVAVYVSPAGAQAASAGLYISNAADIIAMAPGTRIGAGHPVSIFGGAPGGGDEKSGRDYLGEKVENDMAAGVRSIAMNRGRNAEVYEKMVRESISLTEREALEKKVVDLIANDLESLLTALDGRTIARFSGDRQVLSLSGARIERFELTPRQRILAWIADPNVAMILFGIAVLGLFVEFNHPGLILPGVAGGLALLLFAMSLQILPVNILGLLLIALAVALFVLEIKFTSYGFLTIGGIASLTLGFVTLFDAEQMPSLRVSLSFILPTSITVGAVMFLVTTVVVRSQRARVMTGAEALVGEIGEAITALDPAGKVFVHGEYWNARAAQPVPSGRKIRVKAVHDMDLEVEPTDV